ncbi:hypothetical protein LOD99_14563 [Oopsacas minuta]|uniref:Uncharacterized protein n=1 Tax=Oopsacas minuta TaxID=111878 RepID=A0AAV7KFG1_9METZ|nr:hypothetical protein LOD99_14563 [Oopsacas minuta]
MCLSNPLSKVDWLIPALLCLSYIFEIQQVRIILMDFQTLLQAVVKSLFMFISQTLGESFSNRFRFSISNAFPHLRDIENLNILLDILPTHLTERYFPSCLIFPIRSLLISLCHSEQYYNSLIIPLSIFDDIQQFEFIIRSSSFPQLPLSQFRDANGFSEMMKRISTLGMLYLLFL